MRRRPAALTLGLALAAVALAGLGALLVLRPGPAPTAAERAHALAAELRCPDCQGLSVADSPTRSAQEIRRQVDELLGGGATADEVRAHFVARYGDWILLAPRSPAYWVIPFAVVAAGLAALAAWLLRGRGGRPAAAPQPLSPDERRRLHEEAEALDA